MTGLDAELVGIEPPSSGPVGCPSSTWWPPRRRSHRATSSQRSGSCSRCSGTSAGGGSASLSTHTVSGRNRCRGTASSDGRHGVSAVRHPVNSRRRSPRRPSADAAPRGQEPLVTSSRACLAPGPGPVDRGWRRRGSGRVAASVPRACPCLAHGPRRRWRQRRSRPGRCARRRSRPHAHAGHRSCAQATYPVPVRHLALNLCPCQGLLAEGLRVRGPHLAAQ